MPKRVQSESDGDEFIAEDEVSEEEFIVDDDEDFGAKTKKKKPAAKAKAATAKGTKGGTKREADGDGEGSKPKPKKAKAPPPPKEPTTYDDGWTVHPTSLIYKANPAAQGGTKIAALDLDGTIITRKSDSKWGPLDANDWKWFNPSVPGALKKLHSEGHQLVIFSNQGGIKGAMLGAASTKIRALIDNVLTALKKEFEGDAPVQVLIATTNDNFRKPSTGMWEFFVKELNAGVIPDKEQSFFVGDAAGRADDINDGAATDKEFAANVGIEFKLPEDFFGPPSGAGAAAGPSTSINGPLADAFRELASLLKAANESFKSGAFAKVAIALEEFPSKITSSKDLKGVKGVGKSSCAKIDEFLETGKLAAVDELKAASGTVAPQSKEAEMAFKFI